MSDRVGQQFGNYRLIRLLGRGAFADVYLGEHLYLGIQAAVKVLQTRLTDESLELFLGEARTIVRLEHPHIVRVLECGVENQLPFLVMSYAPGGSLRQRYARGTRLRLEEVLLYVKQIASALQYAHDRKLIHRDVKPENMLLGQHGEVLLSDFGLVLAAQSTASQVTTEMAGTVSYMAPEQIQGRPRAASDQYALGILAYEWLSGERPFQGSFVEIASQHMVTLPQPLCSRIFGLSPVVERVVFTALAKDPEQRFPSVQLFATALEEAYHDEATLLRPVKLVTSDLSLSLSAQPTAANAVLDQPSQPDLRVGSMDAAPLTLSQSALPIKWANLQSQARSSAALVLSNQQEGQSSQSIHTLQTGQPSLPACANATLAAFYGGSTPVTPLPDQISRPTPWGRRGLRWSTISLLCLIFVVLFILLPLALMPAFSKTVWFGGKLPTPVPSVAHSTSVVTHTSTPLPTATPIPTQAPVVLSIPTPEPTPTEEVPTPTPTEVPTAMPVREINNDDPGIGYTGSCYYNRGLSSQLYNNDVEICTQHNDSFTYTFTGTSIYLVTVYYQHYGGTIWCYIDGSFTQSYSLDSSAGVDMYGLAYGIQLPIASKLAYKQHMASCTMMSASGKYFFVDALIINK